MNPPSRGRTGSTDPRWFRLSPASLAVDGLRGLFLADGLLQELRQDRFRRGAILSHLWHASDRRIDLGASEPSTTGATIFRRPLAVPTSPAATSAFGSASDGFTSCRHTRSWTEPGTRNCRDAVSRGCRRPQRPASETSNRSELAAQSQHDADRTHERPPGSI